jgi:hypothetical protein
MSRVAMIGLTLAFLPAVAWANTGVGFLLLAVPAMILALVPVILVEAPVLSAILKLPFWPGISLSTSINIRSTLLGVLIALVVDFTLAMLSESSGMPPGRATMIASLIPMFFITWWIERRAVIRLLPDRAPGRVTLAALAANALSYLLLCFAIAWLPYLRDLDRQDYRWQMSEVLVAGSGWRNAIEQYWTEQKRFPENAADIGLVSPVGIRRLGRISLEPGGRIVLTLAFPSDPEMDGKHVIMEPRAEGQGLRWKCGSLDFPHRYLPASCRDEIAQGK